MLPLGEFSKAGLKKEPPPKGGKRRRRKKVNHGGGLTYNITKCLRGSYKKIKTYVKNFTN
jgi:hypothetical protein